MDTFSRRQKERAYIFDIWGELGYQPFDTRVIYRGNISNELISYDWLENSHTISPSQLNNQSKAQVVDYLRKLGPFFLHVYPSSLLSLVELLGEKDFRSLAIQGVLAGSEAFPPAQMKAFSDRFNLRIAYWYGHSEYASLARYCCQCEGFHFYPTYGFTEFVEGHDGLHNIVVTSFNHIGTRFVRYDTGDMARLSERECSLPFQRIDEVAGRFQEYFVDRDGIRRAFGPFLFGIHNRFWDLINAVQFFQKIPGTLGVRLSFKSTTSPADRRWLYDFLNDRFSPVNLEFHPVDAIGLTSAGKHRYFINECTE